MAERKPVAVVVGATGGIGRAVTMALSEEGYALCLSGRDEAALKSMAAGLPDATWWPVDLDDAVPDVPLDLPDVDVLVHCAGVFDSGTVYDMPESQWRQVFSVNLFGVVELTKKLLPRLRAARGRVVLVNSTVVRRSAAGRSAYAASKEALRVFAEALHQEELDRGIRVTTIYPGRVATQMQRTVRRGEGGPFEPSRYLTPETVAAAVLLVLATPPDGHLTEFVLKPAR
ncbi:SDR family oxidoreductase [Amycolatopsis pithecellobii]|uniref:SDR family oxidoreductase n=1 Tax=Amycolatopsis pithecellobii TaxID=664692 RepID=UPI0028AEF062|nr:SDR family oxidoreductase [Amycolatopsis pithecellobii]